VARDVVFEVRCHHCQTSFAPETRRCVHCGAPLAPGRPVISTAGEFDPNRPTEEEEEVPTKGPRAVIWVVMALLTAIASVLRTCIE
jgi:hypothetical protein